MAIATINPATGEVVKTFEPISDAQLEEKLQRAVNDVSRIIARRCFADRAAKMMKAAEILEAEKEKFAPSDDDWRWASRNAGRREAAKCATACRYYAENAEKFLADELADVAAKRSFIVICRSARSWR